MSLPINALKDDELLHYSQFDAGRPKSWQDGSQRATCIWSMN